MPVLSFPHRHLLGIEGLSAADLTLILDEAEPWIGFNRGVRKADERLAGLTQINAFFENSTRTLFSFELAGKRLGAQVSNFHPAASWRMTSTSGRIAFRVSAVSIRLSPLRTLEAAGWKLETWAPSLLPASSNENSVRVEFSKKALIWVRPASRSSALRTPRLNAIHGSASSRIKVRSAPDSPSIPSRWRCGKESAGIEPGL